LDRSENVQTRRRSVRLGLAACAAALAGLALPTVAAADPAGSAVMAYQLPCGGSVCEDSSHRLTSDDVVTGNVQLQAETTSTLGLSSVQLQLLVDGEWACLYRWTTSARSGRWERDFDTRQPIHGCDGDRLTDSTNGGYRVRTFATDRAGTQASTPLTLQVSNAPVTPAWAAAPVASHEDGESPRITLKWYSNPEKDVAEYHFLRSDGDRLVEYAVSATRPGSQGCTFADNVYTCIDDDYPAAGYTGNYQYTLVAFRATPDDRSPCSLGGGGCVRSSTSSSHTLALRGPPAPPAPDTNEPPGTDRPGRGGGGGGDGDGGGGTSTAPRVSPEREGPPSLSELAAGANYGFESGTFDRELPYEAPQTFDPGTGLPVDPGSQLAFDPELAASEQSAQRRRGVTALVGGLLALIIAAFLIRLLRDPAR
jgi:hypothetical protein